MNIRKLTAIAAAASLLGACSQYPQGGQPGYGQVGGYDINKEVVGGVVGAGLGAVTGSNIGKGRGQIAAVAIGTLLGAKLGSSVGQSLDRADMIQYNNPWSNPQTGNSGTVVPQGYYQKANGTYCREYTQTINVGGRLEEAYGTACRQNDGTWQITG